MNRFEYQYHRSEYPLEMGHGIPAPAAVIATGTGQRQTTIRGAEAFDHHTKRANHHLS